MNVAVVGLGKLGLPMAALFAHRGHRVVGLDTDAQRVWMTNNRADPLGEPGLGAMLDSLPPQSLTATRDPAAVADADVIFLVVPTPSDRYGAFSSEYVMAALERIGPHLQDRWRTVVVCSTVMPGTMDEVARRLAKVSGRRVGVDIGLAYSPEFIAIGSVLADMANPDFTLVGAIDERSVDDVQGVLRPVVGVEARFSVTTWINAEVAKLAVNAYVTMKISFANVLGGICEQLPGAQASRVTDIAGQDRRIGRDYLTPGGPFGGPCFPRDTVAFAVLARRCGAPPDLAHATHIVNDLVVRRIAQRLSSYRTVAVLGLGYNHRSPCPVTDNSLGLLVINRLLVGGSRVTCHDQVVRAVDDQPGVRQVLAAQEAVDAADAVLVAHALAEYRDLDYTGKVVVDVWGILKPRDGIYQVGTA